MTWRCFYCDIELSSRKVSAYADPSRDARTTDHIIPKSKWDASRYDCNPQLNFVQVCRRCNNVKADMWPLEWLAIMPHPGVQRFAGRLLRMGCDPESIASALARRAHPWDGRSVRYAQPHARWSAIQGAGQLVHRQHDPVDNAPRKRLAER